MDTLTDEQLREIDAQIEREIFKSEGVVLHNGEAYLPPPEGLPQTFGSARRVPRYSTDIAAALLVYRKLNSGDAGFALMPWGDGWRCCSGAGYSSAFEIDGKIDVEASTIEMAICLAARKTLTIPSPAPIPQELLHPAK